MLNHLHPKPVPPARIVVIGAGGFVGKAIADRVERDHVPVLRITRKDVDLLAPDAAERLKTLLKAGDSVVAAAAMAPCKNPEMLRDNVQLALALAQAIKASDPAHVVNISSDAIYSDSKQPLTESSITAPDSLHGIMHLVREAMLKAETRAPFVSVRPSLLYGAGDPHNGYGPNRFRRLAKADEPIVLFGEGEERRDHVLIEDVAELVARILFRRSTGVLNIATGVTTSFRDIADQVVRISGKPISISGSPRSGPMPHDGYRPFAIEACKAAFPDFAYVTLADGLAKAWRQEI